MTGRMRVGVACEGRTDFVLLSEVIVAVFGPGEVVPLAPHGITSKSAPLYREMAPVLAARLADICGAVSELGRFVGKLEACRG